MLHLRCFCLESVDSNLKTYNEADGLEQASPVEYCRKWPCPGSPREQCKAQMEIETEDIRIHYVRVTSKFVKSYLDRERREEVSFIRLSHVIKNLFDFDLQSFEIGTEKLLFKVLDQQSYANYDCIEAIISECGSPEDIENVKQYTESFKAYAKSRIFEMDLDMLGKEIPGHEIMMFVLDEDQNFRLKDAIKFKLRVCRMLGLKNHQIKLHQLKSGSVIVFIQIPSSHCHLFSTLPLFHDRLLFLQEWHVQRYELENEMVDIGNWNILTSLHLERENIMCIAKTDFFSANLNGTEECLALEYTESFTDESTAKAEYVQYINCFFSGKFKNLPKVKGIFYSKSKHGMYSYPTLIMEKIKPLINMVSEKQEILAVTQISFLHDICCTISSFKENSNYQISVTPDSVFIQENSIFDSEISAYFCPLYGHSFHIKEDVMPDEQSSSYPTPLALKSLQWMNDLIKFIHFKSKVTASSELPDDHILKKMFNQKWMSEEECFRPTNFKALAEELHHLLGKFKVGSHCFHPVK